MVSYTLLWYGKQYLSYKKKLNQVLRYKYYIEFVDKKLLFYFECGSGYKLEKDFTYMVINKFNLYLPSVNYSIFY